MNGYCTIEIDSQKVGLKFAFPAVKWYTEELIKNDIYNITNVEGLAKLLQCAYRNNCLIKEVEPELKYESFFNWVEENNGTEEGEKELTRVVDVYKESSVAKQLEKKSQLIENSTLTKSNPSSTES